MVLRYAEGGSLHNWMNLSNDGYYNDIAILRNIIRGLEKIHGRKMVHRDFHIGNILLRGDGYNASYISDMGLCGEVVNIKFMELCLTLHLKY